MNKHKTNKTNKKDKFLGTRKFKLKSAAYYCLYCGEKTYEHRFCSKEHHRLYKKGAKYERADNPKD